MNLQVYPAKAETVLGWKRTMNFEELIRAMTLAEMEELKAAKD
ncbi:MAG: hypothetical protein K0Q55_1453 [Verrucomicrobia bacterium]|nr:hypothetical protein [Verrucomicrobiota bacterium]